MAPQRKCQRCGIPVGPKKHYCEACLPIHTKEVRHKYKVELWAKKREKTDPKFVDRCIVCGKILPARKPSVKGNRNRLRPKFCSKSCRTRRDKELWKADNRAAEVSPDLARILGLKVIYRKEGSKGPGMRRKPFGKSQETDPRRPMR